MADAPLIRVERLCKQYEVPGGQPVPVLHDVDLVIAGELVAIMGPSGSGKSTFMNILGCLDTPTTGLYRLQGRDWRGCRATSSGPAQPAHRVRLPGFNLLKRVTAADNVALPLLYAGSPSRAQPAAAPCSSGWGSAAMPGRCRTRCPVGSSSALHCPRPGVRAGADPRRRATGNLDTHTSGEIMDLFTELNREQADVVIVTTRPRGALRAPPRALRRRARGLRWRGAGVRLVALPGRPGAR